MMIFVIEVSIFSVNPSSTITAWCDVSEYTYRKSRDVSFYPHKLFTSPRGKGNVEFGAQNKAEVDLFRSPRIYMDNFMMVQVTRKSSLVLCFGVVMGDYARRGCIHLQP